GTDPFSLDEPRLAEFRNRHIGFVFQDHYLLPQLTVLENVLIPAMARGAPTSDMVARAKHLLDRVGLAERLDHRPAELSGGERQRAGVVRTVSVIDYSCFEFVCNLVLVIWSFDVRFRHYYEEPRPSLADPRRGCARRGGRDGGIDRRAIDRRFGPRQPAASGARSAGEDRS